VSALVLPALFLAAILLNAKRLKPSGEEKHPYLKPSTQASYIRLMESFSKELEPKASDYPCWYGGSYTDWGVLTICITPSYFEPERLEAIKEHVAIITLGGNIRYEPCKYSYRRLSEAMDILNGILLSGQTPAMADSVYGIALSGGKENRIVTCLKECTNESIIEFKNSFLNSVPDSNCIVFTQGFPAILE